MPKKVFICILVLLLFTGCNDTEGKTKREEFEQWSNLQKAEYFIKLAENEGILAHSQNYSTLAQTYLLKELVSIVKEDANERKTEDITTR